MGAAAIALLAAGALSSAEGDNVSTRNMQNAVGAEGARQDAFNKQLNQKQKGLLKTGIGAPNVPKQQAQVLAADQSYDTLAKNIAGATAANAGSMPATARSGVISGAAGVPASSSTLSALLARRQVMGQSGLTDQDAISQYLLDRQRLQSRAQGSASLLPYDLDAAARTGDTWRDVGQLASLAGAGMYSRQVNQPSSQPMGYSNSPYAYNRLLGPAR